MTDLEVQESIYQFGTCMGAIGVRCPHGEKRKVSARIRNLKPPFQRGEIDINFTLLNPKRGPEILCEDHLMHGYGIPFEDFKPWMQKFYFDVASSELHIEDVRGKKYDFIFCF